MLGRTHVAGAVATVAVAGPYLAAASGSDLSAPAFVAVSAGAAAVAAKLPDIDRHINSGPDHRSLTHSVVPVAAAVVVVLSAVAATGEALAMAAALGGATGYISHLVLDALTPARIPLVAPGIGPKVGFGVIDTGGFGDFVVFCVCCVVALAAFATGGGLL